MAEDLTTGGIIKAANEALVQCAPDFNIARQFAYDFSGDIADLGSGVMVPVASYATITGDYELAGLEFDVTGNNYETPNGGFKYEEVKLNAQPKSTFVIKHIDVLKNANAPFWTKAAETMANSIRATVSQKLGGLFTTTACTGGKAVLATTFDEKALAGLRTACTTRVADTVLALAPDYYARALSLFDSSVYGSTDPIKNGMIPGLYGFKSVICMKDLPSTVKGALIPANAVGVVSRGAAIADTSCYAEFGNVSDEAGFTMSIFRHTAPATGQSYVNATTLFGAKILQPSFVKYIAAS